ncbi:Chromosome transmission fidelity protein 18 [Penicillium maclennaniae]|uniref:Chromosome transmission fidelity protein 18 n=1 Tax=Penicillium maclennaniae TaxID=1343394 RepID=UPI00254256F8|nr:Chromosome transmission fidelity protein 18 [Penicillium maclennaniae]KAJ5665409.1 Chromosome transmission fidelity protein 18 [Penicillium maclennaniae]
MIPSSPNILSSFDPALHLHSEDLDNAPNLPSESFSDDLDAIHFQRREQTRNKVVIQHRAWNLSDVFRSDDDIRPDTPTKAFERTPRKINKTPTRTISYLASSPPLTNMPFISSPAPAALAKSDGNAQKRKAAEAEETSTPTEPKRQKFVGGFVDEDDDGEDGLAALGDQDFELQEYPEPHPSELTAILEQSQLPVLSQHDNTTPTTSNSQPELISQPASGATKRLFQIKTCTGKTHHIPLRMAQAPVSYERMIASRSETDPGRARKSYYGIEIHTLLDDAAKETYLKASEPAPPPPVQVSIEKNDGDIKQKKMDSMMWTEKYRARKFTDLIGDERTHRQVLRWLKGWDSIVYPGLSRSQKKKSGQDNEEERVHRKVLLLSGPPGLGKTTLAHVCAKQAGYEVLEINASDERSKDVVKGRIRDALATENVKGANVEVGENKVRRAAKPVCVVVDEVDGVVGGAGSGVMLDQRNSKQAENGGNNGKKRKGDTFRFLRPLILICNDLYASSLRPLRTSSIAEIINCRQAPLENVVNRVKHIFTREGIAADGDGARRLCEAAWGMGSKKQRGPKSSGSAEGDIRSVLVAAEWVAHKLRSEGLSTRLSRNWLESRVLNASTEGGSFFKEMSRGGVREIVNRVFTEGAGFSDSPVGMTSFQDKYDGSNSKVPVGVADLRKRHAINRLREMVDASGDHDRCVTDCFAAYPIQQYQDDTFLSKPCDAYDWLHFHDSISNKVHASQEWELAPYLSQSVMKTEKPKKNTHSLALKAEFAAFEAQKENRAILTGFHSSLSAPMSRMFRSTESVVTDLLPHLLRMLSPDVKPVIVRTGGDNRSTASVRKESERVLVQSAVRVMAGMGVTFEKVRVEHEGGGHGGWAYRMEPPIDSLVAFSKLNTSGSSSANVPVRYAVRSVLDQEFRKESTRKQFDSRNAVTAKSILGKSPKLDAAKVIKHGLLKRDFFGRIIEEPVRETGEHDGPNPSDEMSKAGRKVWVTYHEGFSNAVRKPISMGELLTGL